MASSAQPCCPDCPDSFLPVCRALAVTTGLHTTVDAAQREKAGAAPGDSHLQLFSTKPPRDFIAGCSSGAKTILRSFSAGAMSLATKPGEGASQGGVLGAAVGLGEGVVDAVVMPAAGVVVGAVQCARGLASTPAAVWQSFMGRQWDDDTRTWQSKVYILKDEAKEISARDEGCPPDASSTGSPCRKAGAHTGYYSILKVDPNATETEIRKAYYRESRRCHPDKAGADRTRIQEFQQLSEAYRVLQNAQLRRAYDRGGVDEIGRRAFTIDLGVLYGAFLSSRQWQPYLGDLALVRLLSTDEFSDSESGCDALLLELLRVGDEVQDQRQVKREVQCAMLLAERLQAAYKEGFDIVAFKQAVKDEATKLLQAPFAAHMLAAIAEVYSTEAQRFLGAASFFDARWECSQVQGQGRLLLQQANAVASSIMGALAVHDLIIQEAEEGNSAASRSEEGGTAPQAAGSSCPGPTSLRLDRPEMQERIPALAAALWQVTLLDIEGTIRRVCRRVLRDCSEDFGDRMRRAEALHAMASVMRETAEKHFAETQTSSDPLQDKHLLRSHVTDVVQRLCRGYADGDGVD
eukprot:TRINITY_DN110923_c0_g1_i1.p1 TRINITY_DN110923_c0_g1~~TRINITY_DN110923_c0_g1_i1.p1  ORF type:complete len:594 (-),score=96.17 TRINITY_DN110923_c0_g1_i1:269-1999(-)